MIAITEQTELQPASSQDPLTMGATSSHVASGEGGLVAATSESSTAQSRSSVSTIKGLQRLICFFGLIVALIFTLNAVISFGMRGIKTSSYGAWNQAMQGKVNADVVISGSSRSSYHYDPRVLEAVTGHSAFNLGKNGSQTDVQLAVLKAYLEHNQKPKMVIHNLDAFSFVMTREIYDPAQYVPYLNDQELYQSLHQVYPNFAKSRYLPLYGYVVEDVNLSWIIGVKSLVGWSPDSDCYLGFTPRDIQWTDEFQNFKGAHPTGVSFAVEPAGLKVLTQLIELCKQNGIELVFVYSPEYSEMQALTNNRTEIFSHFKELAGQYNVPLWDYSDWKYNGNREYFYNSQHLNAAGAAIFSQDLANRLKAHFAEHSEANREHSQVSHQVDRSPQN